MTVPAVLDERGLERRLDAGNFGEIDIAAKRFARCAFEIEFLYAAIADDDHPRFLGVGGIDKHFVGFRHGFNSWARHEAAAPVPVVRPLAVPDSRPARGL